MAGETLAMNKDRSKWLKRIARLFLPPDPVEVKRNFNLRLADEQLLERIEKLKATIDGEEKWFLCLTRDQRVCFNPEEKNNEYIK